MTGPVRILIVDDHPLVRRGLGALTALAPDLQVCAMAADAVQAIQMARSTQPHVVLLDNHMPGRSGIEAIPDLLSACPGCAVLMLTVSEEEADLTAALRAGARGYLLKNIEFEALASAIRRAAGGESVLSPEMAGTLMHAFQQAAPGAQAPFVQAPVAAPLAAPSTPPGPGPIPSPVPITPREAEVLAGIARGAGNKEIARDLGIAESTVKQHVQSLLRKFDVSSRVQLAVHAAMHPRRTAG